MAGAVQPPFREPILRAADHTAPSMTAPAGGVALAITAAIAATTLPSLLAYNLPPSPTFLNQALAFGLWAGFVAVSAPALPRRDPWPVLVALAALLLAAAWSWGPGALPASLAVSAIGTLLAAGVLLLGGAGARVRPDAQALFAAFCWGWVAAGVLNVGVALVQVFLPGLAEGDWIAASGFPGRAVGNLRQPNHLSSLLLWHCIAVIALLELGRLQRGTAAVLLAVGVYAVVLTASRTGVVSVLLLALWALLDRKLSRPARLLLLAAPLVYLLSWLAMAQWAAASQHTFGGTERLAETDISSSRFAIWRDTLGLIRQHPWAGVGFGEYNFAWTLSVFPNRPVAFFDHAHNLPLHLLAELGLPLGLGVTLLLLWGLLQGALRAWQAHGAAGTTARCAMVMVAMIGLHSLLEYPLWYSYFLLPAAWAWGFALQALPAVPALSAAPAPAPARAVPPAARPLAPPDAPTSSALTIAAMLVVGGAALSIVDYLRVAQIFTASTGGVPLERRIAAGQHSVFFAHHADYAAATSGVPVDDPARAFARATHYLLDTRLMMAWAQALAAQGDVDAARYLAARLREFRKVDAEDFFKPCPDAAVAPAPGLPFQCELPQQPHPWRSFTLPRP